MHGWWWESRVGYMTREWKTDPTLDRGKASERTDPFYNHGQRILQFGRGAFVFLRSIQSSTIGR